MRLCQEKLRIDAAGALHHIIVRGIERRKILRKANSESSQSVMFMAESRTGDDHSRYSQAIKDFSVGCEQIFIARSEHSGKQQI